MTTNFIDNDTVSNNGKIYRSSQALAKKYGIARDYVSHLACRGKLAAIRIGRTWYVSEESATVWFTHP